MIVKIMKFFRSYQKWFYRGSSDRRCNSLNSSLLSNIITVWHLICNVKFYQSLIMINYNCVWFLDITFLLRNLRKVQRARFEILFKLFSFSLLFSLYFQFLFFFRSQGSWLNSCLMVSKCVFATYLHLLEL